MNIRAEAPTAVERGISTDIAGGRDFALVTKRTLDLIGATTLLVVLLPAVLVIGLLVYVSSPGPVFFRQRRVGRDGRLFSFYKFRTMYYGTDDSAHRAYYEQLVDGTARPNGGSYKLEDDPRVTPLGRMLRRFSFDEIPQLLNVLLGDMSLVGPRPPIPYEVELYSPRAAQRLSVTPGLTGLWQVSGRSTLSFQEMIELDLVYISRWSLTFDLLILLRTPRAVISGVGAC